MKKTAAFILAAALVLSCLSGCGRYEKDTVMEVNKSPVSWDELMYWIGQSQTELQQYYGLYGEEIEWSGQCLADESLTCAQWVIERAKMSATQVHALISNALENGVVITEEDEAEIEEMLSQNIESYCGKGATESDFESFIKPAYYSLDYYKEMLRTNYYYTGLTEKLYGVNGEKLADTDILAYAKDNNYSALTYIMLSLTDDSGNSLGEQGINRVKQQAESLAEEINAIENGSERPEKFNELKNEFCQDPSKTTYPDGYCFAADKAEGDIETAATDLEEYEISEPVLTDDGCYIVMRIPVSVSAYCRDGNGLPISLRTVVSKAMLDKKIGEWIEAADTKMVGKYKKFDFTSLFDENGFNYQNYKEFSVNK